MTLDIAKQKNTHTIAEILNKTCVLKMAAGKRWLQKSWLHFPSSQFKEESKICLMPDLRANLNFFFWSI